MSLRTYFTVLKTSRTLQAAYVRKATLANGGVAENTRKRAKRTRRKKKRKGRKLKDSYRIGVCI